MIINLDKKCPICNKILNEEKYSPFCCKRCADVDLNRWFNGSYSIPVVENDQSEDIEQSS